MQAATPFTQAAILSVFTLGWDPRAWVGGDGVHKRPWTFHLGAKLLLPLEYLRRCAPPNDTLVVFTDHDVIFQASIDT